MRRTYRSKKDTAGALDPRDVLQNVDEKSSAFDAFYIHKIKQTKRELSCVASSNLAGAPSNKVRKRKYVKRILKESRPVRHREAMSSSAYLTPDKSIRVNKILDPFDMLLNSSPANGEQLKPEADVFVRKKESKTYVRKRRPNKKKINYSISTDSSIGKESDKENSTETNVTDIKLHDLLVEPKITHKTADDSIQSVLKNLPILHNLKSTNPSGSFNTSYRNKSKLSKVYVSPALQKSPLCSTPFKEKYRGVSIYNFSPITQKGKQSPVPEALDDSNHSIILVSKSIPRKVTHESKDSMLAGSSTSIKKLSNLPRNDNVYVSTEAHKDGNEIESVNDETQNELTANVDESNSLQLTVAEPFLGFSINEAENISEVRKKILPRFEDSQFSENCMDRDKSGPEINESNNVSSDSSQEALESIQSEANLTNITGETLPDESSNGVDFCDVTKCTDNSYKYNESSVSQVENSNDESQYDTCNSNQNSAIDDTEVEKEPLVVIEKIDDSVFFEYYQKMIVSREDDMSEKTDDDDFENLANETDEENSDESIDDDCNETKYKLNPIVTTDSSITDNIVSIEDVVGDKYEYDGEERCISFVTTRRRNEMTKDSMFMFDQSYSSNSTDCDKTVLSNNKVSVDNSNDITLEDLETKIGSEEPKADNVNDISLDKRQSVRKNSFLRIESANSTNTRITRMSTRKSTKISRQSKVSSISKENKSPTSKTKTVTRRSSKLPKKSYSISSESENEKSIVDTNEKEANDKTVFDINNVEGKQKLSLHTIRKEKKSPTSKTKIITEGSSKLPKKSYSISSESENEKNTNEKEANDKTFVDINNVKGEQKLSLHTKNVSIMNPERLSYIGAEGKAKPGIVLQPGKKWERSLSIYRRITMADQEDHSILEESMQNKGRKYRQSVIMTMEMQESRDPLHNDSINSRRSTFVSNPNRSTFRFVKDPNISRVSLNTSVFDDLKGYLSEECDDTVIELSKLSIADSEHEITVLDNFHELERVTTAKDYVLRRCNQTEPILFDECYPETVLKNCHKIGEGVYGEVFLWRARDGRARVMKIVPIAGAVKVNGEAQKDFHEIISEIVIAMELSALRAPIADIERQLDDGRDIHALDLHQVVNATDIFNEVLAVRCVHGPYPSRLLDLWELYDECKGSENDNPASLPPDQRYIVLELANAGQDLESFQFASAQQAHALFQQLAFGLAVGEEAFQFEHRDLHWGNVLIAPTDQKCATFVLRGRTYRVARRGVSATVIDYSLSRISLPLAGESASLYNDLATDDQLFDAVGDYQFEVYRLMRDKLGNDWKNFEPYTNILWLHYIVDKMITALRYKRTNTKIHKHYIEKLTAIKNSILDYESAVHFVLNNIEF